MYEQIYNLTSMFFKSLKGKLMYEFLISKFNGKRGPKRKLSLEQIVALNIYRFHFKTGDFENIIFSYANFADCKITEKLAEVVKGTIFADAGYLQKKDILKRKEEEGIRFEAAPNVPALFI